MLVRIDGDPAALAYTEQRTVGWLHSWRDMAGFAIANTRVPRRQTDRPDHRADVIVWTPHTCVVVEVMGLTTRITAPVDCWENREWTAGEAPAPLFSSSPGNPFGEVSECVRDLEHLFREHGTHHVVAGVVLVIPQLGSNIEIRCPSRSTGLTVVDGAGSVAFRGYLEQAAKRAVTWDAAAVRRSLDALHFDPRPTFDELRTAGFPAPDALPTATVPMPATPLPAPAPEAATAAGAREPTLPTTIGTATDANAMPRGEAPRPGPADKPRFAPVADARHETGTDSGAARRVANPARTLLPWPGRVLVVVIVATAITAWVMLGRHRQPHPGHAPGSTPAGATSSQSTTQTPTTSRPPEIGSAPVCFPFQPSGC